MLWKSSVFQVILFLRTVTTSDKNHMNFFFFYRRGWVLLRLAKSLLSRSGDLFVVNKMKWVTRERVHVDRVACPWLITRFIDPDAEFVFVPPDTDPKTIQEGIPFDMKGVELGHHEGKCSFEAFVSKYNIDDPAVAELAKIVHGADVEKDKYKYSEAAGLETIAFGMMFLVKDDYEALEKGFFIYDALYTALKARRIIEKDAEKLETMNRNEKFSYVKSRL